MNDFNKHYIRVEDTLVVKGFSDAFETPLETDICINEKGGRHFEIDGVVNPPLYDDRMCHIYRYDTELRKATEEELEAEWQEIKPEEQLSETEKLKNQVAALEEELTNTQLSLVEQYEENIALQEEVTNTQLALCEIYEAMEV